MSNKYKPLNTNFQVGKYNQTTNEKDVSMNTNNTGSSLLHSSNNLNSSNNTINTSEIKIETKSDNNNDILILGELKNNLSILELEEDKLVFKLENTYPSFVNAIRRIANKKIPTVAIHIAVIYENKSFIIDEHISQRLGLIPIKITCNNSQIYNKIYKVQKDIDEEYAEDRLREKSKLNQQSEIQKSDRQQNDQKDQPKLKNTFSPEDDINIAYYYLPIFELNVSNNTDEEKSIIKTVYVKDLKLKNPSSDYTVTFPNPDIPICKLGPNQSIHLECFCKTDVSETHPKWSAVSCCFYKAIPNIKLRKNIKNNIPKRIFENLSQVCPSGVFFTNSSQNSEIEDIEDIGIKPEKCTFCQQCIDEYGDVVEMDEETGNYIFTIESLGKISPVEILSQTFDILASLCK